MPLLFTTGGGKGRPTTFSCKSRSELISTGVAYRSGGDGSPAKPQLGMSDRYLKGLCCCSPVSHLSPPVYLSPPSISHDVSHDGAFLAPFHKANCMRVTCRWSHLGNDRGITVLKPHQQEFHNNSIRGHTTASEATGPWLGWPTGEFKQEWQAQTVEQFWLLFFFFKSRL